MNLVCTHELMSQRLVEQHGSDPTLQDHSGRNCIDLVLLSTQGRPESPYHDVKREQQLIQDRRIRIHTKNQACIEAQKQKKYHVWKQEIDRMALDFIRKNV